MKLLVLGADSLLGQALVQLLQQQGLEHVSLNRDELNLLKKMDVVKLLTRSSPTQVIHTAIYTTPELAEKNRDEAERSDIINTRGLSILAEVCSQLGLPLLYHSGSLVFDGNKTHPYMESDETNPVSRYGKSLWFGERAVRDGLESHVILRTDWIFSGQNPAFFLRHIEACRKKLGKLEVMNMRFSPTPAADVARVILAIANQVDCAAEVWGTYHYCAQQPLSQESFVEQFLHEAARHDPELEPGMSDMEITRLPVVLPYISNTVLSCQNIFETFGIRQRSRNAELSALVRNLYNIQSALEPELRVEGFDDREIGGIEEIQNMAEPRTSQNQPPPAPLKAKVRKPREPRQPARKAATQKASPRS